ncbi:uncharacterized protein [Nicotiana sylvestris]|uniref:Uncharacterized protein LOC104228949 n=1 Tax=Nicotiana sylvestris TaxID=4096 RepID=A0A1U7WIP1_NICSY|nr:PREDICTED: uncharacterized protein LOC104228949 [Nicotiana sylvestris]
MDESNYYFMRRSHVPAFGCWDCNDNEFPIPFTQCFESARQAGLLRYSYYEDPDLYVAGDLYQNDIVTPTMIVVPRRKRKAVGKEGRKDCEYDDVKEGASPVPPAPHPSPKRAPKAVDEDLYKISPTLLYAKPKRKGFKEFFSSCLRPICVS